MGARRLAARQSVSTSRTSVRDQRSLFNTQQHILDINSSANSTRFTSTKQLIGINSVREQRTYISLLSFLKLYAARIYRLANWSMLLSHTAPTPLTRPDIRRTLYPLETLRRRPALQHCYQLHTYTHSPSLCTYRNLRDKGYSSFLSCLLYFPPFLGILS